MQLKNFATKFLSNTAHGTRVNDIINQFVDLFEEELGHVVGVKVHTELHSEATPQF